MMIVRKKAFYPQLSLNMVSAPKALEEVRFPFQTLNLLMMVMVMTTVLVMIMTI